MKLAIRQPIKRSIPKGINPWTPAEFFRGREAGFLALPFVTDAAGVIGAGIGEITNQANATPKPVQATGSRKPPLARYPKPAPGGVGGIRTRILNSVTNAAWVITNTAGEIAITAVGSGTEDGLPYTDYSFVGTDAGGADAFITFNATSTIAALVAEDWVASVYSKLVSGSMANLVLTNEINERSSGNTSLAQSGQAFVPTGAALSTQRVSHARVLTNGSGTTAFINQRIRVAPGNLGAVNCVIRLAVPQPERGTVASPPQLRAAVNDVTEDGFESVHIPYYAGDDVLGFGTNDLGDGTKLTFAVGKPFSLLIVGRTLVTGGVLLSSALSDVASDWPFALRITASTFMQGLMNGATNSALTGAYTDGNFHISLLCWDGVSSATIRTDNGADIALTIGSAPDEGAEILIGARRPASPTAFWTGHLHAEMLGAFPMTALEKSQAIADAAGRFGRHWS